VTHHHQSSTAGKRRLDALGSRYSGARLPIVYCSSGPIRKSGRRGRGIPADERLIELTRHPKVRAFGRGGVGLFLPATFTRRHRETAAFVAHIAGRARRAGLSRSSFTTAPFVFF